MFSSFQEFTSSCVKNIDYRNKNNNIYHDGTSHLPQSHNKHEQGQDREHRPGYITAGDLPIGRLRILRVGNPKTKMPAEQLVGKQDAEGGHSAEEQAAEPAKNVPFMRQFGAGHQIDQFVNRRFDLVFHGQ